MAKRMDDSEIEISKECNVCKHSITFSVSENGYRQFLKGTHVQVALPGVAAGLREMLLSGICPKCWDELFNDKK